MFRAAARVNGFYDFARALEREINANRRTIAELTEALQDSVSLLAGLASSELSIDQDRNRTPQRLAMRDDIYAGLDAARSALARANEAAR